MWRVSTAPTATAGNSGLNWEKFSLSTSGVSQYSRASRERPMARATSRPPNPPPRIKSLRPGIPPQDSIGPRGAGARALLASACAGTLGPAAGARRGRLARGLGPLAVAPEPPRLRDRRGERRLARRLGRAARADE